MSKSTWIDILLCFESMSRSMTRCKSTPIGALFGYEGLNILLYIFETQILFTINLPLQFCAQVGKAKQEMQNTNAILINIMPALFKPYHKTQLVIVRLQFTDTSIFSD